MTEEICLVCMEASEIFTTYNGQRICDLCAEFFETEREWRQEEERHLMDEWDHENLS